MWSCTIVPNLSMPDNETSVKELLCNFSVSPEPHFSSSVNEKRVNEDAGKWTVNTSTGSIDFTAFLDSITL